MTAPAQRGRLSELVWVVNGPGFEARLTQAFRDGKDDALIRAIDPDTDIASHSRRSVDAREHSRPPCPEEVRLDGAIFCAEHAPLVDGWLDPLPPGQGSPRSRRQRPR